MHDNTWEASHQIVNFQWWSSDFIDSRETHYFDFPPFDKLVLLRWRWWLQTPVAVKEKWIVAIISEQLISCSWKRYCNLKPSLHVSLNELGSYEEILVTSTISPYVIVFSSFLEKPYSDMMIDFESDIFLVLVSRRWWRLLNFFIEECDFIGYY